MKQPHGGALLAGGVPGNKGGSGRPSWEIREAMLGDFDALRHVLPAIAANPKEPSLARIRALDTLAKYGLGPDRQCTVDEVRSRLVQTIAILRSRLDPKVCEEVLDEMESVWR